MEIWFSGAVTCFLLQARAAAPQSLVTAPQAPNSDNATGTQPAHEQVLLLQEQARKHANEGAALQRLAEAAEARAHALQREASKHAEEKAALQRRAEAAEARVLEVHQKVREESAVAEAAAAGIPALMRAAEGVGGLVERAELRDLLVLEGTWAVAVETIRAERIRRAREMPERFICPISRVSHPAPPFLRLPPFDPRSAALGPPGFIAFDRFLTQQMFVAAMLEGEGGRVERWVGGGG